VLNLTVSAPAKAGAFAGYSFSVKICKDFDVKMLNCLDVSKEGC
jgi:hypothetical protein